MIWGRQAWGMRPPRGPFHSVSLVKGAKPPPPAVFPYSLIQDFVSTCSNIHKMVKNSKISRVPYEEALDVTLRIFQNDFFLI
jgi:hypothetical protein